MNIIEATKKATGPGTYMTVPEFEHTMLIRMYEGLPGTCFAIKRGRLHAVDVSWAPTLEYIMRDDWIVKTTSMEEADPDQDLTDNVNSPAHYMGEIETIDFIRDKLTPDQFEGYCIGNTIKYLSRYQKKGAPLEDLRKAQVYLGWAIETIETLEKGNPTINVGLSEKSAEILADLTAHMGTKR